MKKILSVIIIICLSSILSSPVNAKAQNITVVCAPGSLINNPPISDIPAYSYQSNGLVQFHFHNASNWAYNQLIYRFYDNNCNYTGLTGYGAAWPNVFPTDTPNFTMKVAPHPQGGYNFEVINSITGQEVGVGPLPPNFDINKTISVGFLTSTGYPGYSTYHEISVFSPAVPIINPNHQSVKTPVLIVPGIMGTEIFKDTEHLWANIDKMMFTNNDRFMDPLAFKDDGTPIDFSLNLGEVIKEKPRFNYSEKLILDLVSQNYESGKTLFTFPYDWRQGIRKTAIENLTGQIDFILNQTEAGLAKGKVDIIAHSQGGLVVKRLLFELPEYKNKINKLVFVGVPNLGAPKAAKALLYGDSMDISFVGMGLDPGEVKRISQNMPAVYELLPSSEYFNHKNGYLGEKQINPSSFFGTQVLNYANTKQRLKDEGLNSALIDRSENFHEISYDNMDFTDSSFNAYNIVGCQEGTIEYLLEKNNEKFRLTYQAGDGTVPIFSANNIPGALTFYALNSSHGRMLSQDGIRQQIVNLIAGSTLSTASKITPFATECHFNGQQVSVHSPVNLQIYDENNNHVGPNMDGTFDYNIEDVQYDVIGEEKFAFLPPGHLYTLKLEATGNGSFDFYSSTIQDGKTINTSYYNQVPITNLSIAEVVLNSENNQVVSLDINNDGIVDKTINPSSILDSNQSQDLTPPISTSTISGLMGQLGYYRGNVLISLSATDQVIPGQENQTSGLLKTQYNLDNLGWSDYSSTTSIQVTAEGIHTISFFSADKAGNNEEPQTITFTIDKTPPEFVVQFNPLSQELQFTATDAATTFIATSTASAKWPQAFQPSHKNGGKSRNNKDNGYYPTNTVTATDAAGNIAILAYKNNTDKKHRLEVEFKSISYNGKLFDTGKIRLSFNWEFDKKGLLKELKQQMQNGKEFNIKANFQNNQTKIVGEYQNNKIKKLINDLVLLKLSTNNGGVLVWGY